MRADQIKKTKVLERNFEYEIMHKKNAIRFERVPNQNTVKVYTDGSKLHGRVDASFYAEHPNNSPKQAFFHLEIHSTVFQAEVFAIQKRQRTCFWKKCTIKVLLCWWIVRQLSNHSNSALYSIQL